MLRWTNRNQMTAVALRPCLGYYGLKDIRSYIQVYGPELNNMVTMSPCPEI